MFVNPELIQWTSLVSVYEKVLKHGTEQLAATDVFNPNTEEGQARWKELKNRVVEHVCFENIFLSISASVNMDSFYFSIFRISGSWPSITPE